MKLVLEIVLVQEGVVKSKNASEYFLSDDAKSCQLLKEYVISYLCLHASDILQAGNSPQCKNWQS